MQHIINKSRQNTTDDFDISPWYPSYVGDHFKETHHLSNEEKGIYCDFLHVFWNNNAALKDDDKCLSRIAHVSLRRWRSIRPALEQFFFIEAGVWVSKRLYSEVSKAKLHRMQKQLAAYIRFENTEKVEEIKQKMEALKHAGAYAGAWNKSMRLQCPSPSPSPPPSLSAPRGCGVVSEKDFVCDESTGELIEKNLDETEVSDELH